MMRNVLILTLTLLTAACSGTETIRITSRPLELDIARVADPQGVQMHPVTFRVVTRDTANGYLDELARAQGGATPVFVAITTRDYENLALNLADLRRYIEQQRSIITYYREMTAPRNTNTRPVNQ